MATKAAQKAIAKLSTKVSTAPSNDIPTHIRSDSKVLLLASGSLSHKIWANEDYAANNGTFTISSEFNRQMDLHVLSLWTQGDHTTFLKILPEYAQKCNGEGGMHDTAMLYGALGWDHYQGKGEIIGEYFPSSGTGQVNVVFEPD